MGWINLNHWTVQYATAAVKLAVENPIIATIGSLIMYGFGFLYGDDKTIKLGMAIFTVLIALDWLAGTSAAKKDGIDTSEYGAEGFKRTLFLLLLPVLGRLLDLVAGTGVMIAGFMIAGLARGVARSVLANMHRSGWGKWIPDVWLSWIEDEIANKDKRAAERLEQIKKMSKF